MRTRVAIGLGSNLGDRQTIIERALGELAATPGVQHLQASRFFETAPIGGPSGQGPFLNAAALCETTVDPETFHGVLRELENRAGRLRRIRWGERTLDLDLLLFGDRFIETDSLVVPHPRMAFRRFVLEPLASIAPDFHHPTTGRTISDLLANLSTRPLRIGLIGWDRDETATLLKALPDPTVAETTPDAQTGFQLLAAPRTERVRVESSPLARAIPTLWLDREDMAGAAQELRATYLSAF